MINEKTDNTGVLPKCMAVLDFIAYQESHATFTEIMNGTGLAKSSLHRIINLLIDNRLIWLNKRTKTYHIGMRIVSLANYALKNMELRKKSEKYLEHLRDITSETSRLAIIDGQDMVYIDHKISSQAVNISFRLGARGPTYCSGTGKAFVAFMPEAERTRLVEALKFKHLTEHTITNHRDFEQELERIRACGYAIDDEEQVLGIRAVGAPILGRDGPIAALSITVPAYRVSVEQLHQWAPTLISIAAKISLDLGGVP